MTCEPQKQFKSVMVALCDINGVYRGKRLPAGQVEKVFSGSFRMPMSACTVDIWGRDIEDSALVFQTGDADGICHPVRDTPMPSAWLGSDVGFLPVCMHDETGKPHDTDPRHALAAIQKRYADQGLRPVVATELEFYLTKVQVNKRGEKKHTSFDTENILSIQEIEAMTPFFNDVYAACADAGIPADAAISECGPGQYEINLLHTDNPLQAADDAMFFKRVIKGFAEAHGYCATFMAKPFGDAAGSGLHIHFSLLNDADENVFDDGSAEGSAVMHAALGGLTAAMQESTLIFAPHQNSYRRIRPNSHAPTTVAWGYENRTAAIRIPGGNPKARRIEHRVAGADANPYLVLSAVLGAALEGMNEAMAPPPPLVGNAYTSDGAQLPLDWAAAIQAFENGPIMAKVFNPILKQLYAQAKQQELHRFLQTVSEFEYLTYRETL